MTQNAKKQALNKEIRKGIAKELRKFYFADDLQQANDALSVLAENYAETAPKLSKSLKHDVPEAITVFSRPKEHQVSMKKSNLIERAINRQNKTENPKSQSVSQRTGLVKTCYKRRL